MGVKILHPRRLAAPMIALGLARVIILLATPLEGMRGYGDFSHFFRLAALPGWPFIHYWVEFPPVFPFLSALVYRATGGQEHVYDYILWILFLAVDLANLGLFIRVWRKIRPDGGDTPIWFYFAILAGLAYSWWYFDTLAVFCLLLAIDLILEGRDLPAAGAIAFGALTKLFPILALALIWRARPWRKALWLSAVTLALVVAVNGGLLLVAPQMASASLTAQANKGSWETVWALVDGNLRTGNFGPESERFNPAAAAQPMGNPARIPSVWVGAAGAALMAAAYFLAKQKDPRGMLSFLGAIWAIAMLALPGWSPQWVLYLLPLILLTLPERQAALFGSALLLVNLLEWPVLLSRGLFDTLWLTVSLRTLLLALLAFSWWQQASKPMWNDVQTIIEGGQP
jgi:hypothetical protein